jgi:organic radical activating enzyme
MMRKLAQKAEQYLKVTEIFYSIQGEGPSMGRPATFLRLAGCNLHCEKCDTKYSWDDSEIEPQTITSVLIALADPEVGNLPLTNYLVITGGEPLLQEESIKSLLYQLPSNMKIGIETNGTIFSVLNRFSPGALRRNIEYIVSSKVSSFSSNISTVPFDPKWTDQNIQYASQMSVQFKFVAGSSADCKEIDQFISKYSIPRQSVWIMPECTTTEQQLQFLPFVWEFCMFRGYNLSARLHILAFNTKKGI